MERLWSPWRLAYVTGAAGAESGTSAVFSVRRARPRREELVLVRTPLSYVILNRYPYNNGHLMVAPRRHVATLARPRPTS